MDEDPIDCVHGDDLSRDRFEVERTPLRVDEQMVDRMNPVECSDPTSCILDGSRAQGQTAGHLDRNTLVRRCTEMRVQDIAGHEPKSLMPWLNTTLASATITGVGSPSMCCPITTMRGW